MNYIKLFETNIRELILNYVHTSNAWFNSNGFTVLKIPPMMINNDVNLFKAMIKFKGNPFVFKMCPNTFYKFHTDEKRKCAINLLLDGFNSNFYFGNISDSEEIIKDVMELKYEKNCLYLINTSNKHAVLNFNNDRYLLSIGFNDFKFNDLLTYFKNETNI